jgi:hypothetical protein
LSSAAGCWDEFKFSWSMAAAGGLKSVDGFEGEFREAQISTAGISSLGGNIDACVARVRREFTKPFEYFKNRFIVKGFKTG